MLAQGVLRRIYLPHLAIALLELASRSAMADAPPGGAPSASDIVTRAVLAHSGGQPLSALTSLEFEVEGRAPAPFQSYRTTPPFTDLPVRAHYWLDFARGRAVEEYASEFPGGYRLASTSISADRAIEIDHRSRTWSVRQSTTISPYRFHPLVALEQFAGSSALTIKGTSVLDGKRVYEVSAGANGGYPVLLIDSADWTLRGLRMSRPHPLDPHGVMTVHYRDYQRILGWLSPAHIEAWYLDEPKAGFDVAVRTAGINSQLSEAAFKVPEGYVAVDPMPSSGPHVRELAEGVYLIERLLGDEYNALVVEFSDHVLVVEAPLDDDAGEQLARQVASIGHGKPIRYLALTHAHEDHIGGVRALLAAMPAPAILSTVEAEPRLRTAASAGSAKPGRILAFEAVTTDRPKTISDGKRRVQLFNLGPNPHTAELLVVYLPEEKILFQADMLTVAHDQIASPPGNAGTVFLDAAIDRLGLDVAYLAGAHGALGTRYDLRRAARLAPRR